jgi:Tol biopolymer transport system component
MDGQVSRSAGAAIAIGLGLVAASLTASGASAAFPGPNAGITFTSDRDGSPFVYDIYSMNADGSNQTRLTTAAAQDLDPAYSPDSEKIAFASLRDGNFEIYVMNADGTGQTNLTNNPATDFGPSWSPDGQKIAFDRNGDIFVMNANGSGQTGLTNDPAQEDSPAWSPDGQKIAYRRGNDIFVMNANGSSQTNLTNTGDAELYPNWSPDGQKLAYTRNVSGGSIEVYAMDANGSNQTNLTNDASNDLLPAWSPDGKLIAFETDRAGGDTEIFVMNANGSAQAPLTDNARSEEFPDWARDTDRDRDGLFDTWEASGADVDFDGTVDLDLPAMGADPDHKDIFLELDYMSGHQLSTAAVNAVVTAFDNAPVTNPDSVSGITMHVDNGSTSVMNPNNGDLWGALSDADAVTHQAVLGSFSSGNYDWTAFDTVKTANFSTDRSAAFHYVVVAHRYGSASHDSSGISRNASGAAFDDGASDLIVSLGPASEPGEGSGTMKQQAGTLMHELGHNLGLHHGGADDVNRKPNYLSIMNYVFQMVWLVHPDLTTELDYSRHPISLNESTLNEATGFGFAAGTPQANFITEIRCPGGGVKVVPLLAGPIDWNCSGFATGVVAADVNQDGAVGSLAPHNDWENLVYTGGEVGSPGVAVPSETDVIEPQLDELLTYEQELLNGVTPVSLPPAEPPAATPPSNEFTITGVKANRRKGTAKLKLEVPGPGTIAVSGKDLKDQEAEAAAAGPISVPIKPKGKAKKKLADRGKAKVAATIVFTPSGGTPNTQDKRIKLVKKD